MKENLLLIKNKAIYPIELIEILGYTTAITFISTGVVYVLCSLFNAEERLTADLVYLSIIYSIIVSFCFQFGVIFFELNDIKYTIKVRFDRVYNIWLNHASNKTEVVYSDEDIYNLVYARLSINSFEQFTKTLSKSDLDRIKLILGVNSNQTIQIDGQTFFEVLINFCKVREPSTVKLRLDQYIFKQSQNYIMERLKPHFHTLDMVKNVIYPKNIENDTIQIVNLAEYIYYKLANKLNPKIDINAFINEFTLCFDEFMASYNPNKSLIRQLYAFIKQIEGKICQQDLE
jgi:hypothetical protein